MVKENNYHPLRQVISLSMNQEGEVEFNWLTLNTQEEHSYLNLYTVYPIQTHIYPNFIY